MTDKEQLDRIERKVRAEKIQETILDLIPVQGRVPISRQLWLAAETEIEVNKMLAEDMYMAITQIAIPGHRRGVRSRKVPASWRDHVAHHLRDQYDYADIKRPLLVRFWCGVFDIPQTPLYNTIETEVVKVCPHLDVDIKGARDRMAHILWMKGDDRGAIKLINERP